MSLVESLPPRPLDPEELLELNSAEALDLAVPIEDEGRVSGVLVATDAWVRGLALDGDAGSWTVVETVALGEDTERVDGLQACEASILRFRGEDPAALSPDEAPGSYEPAVPDDDGS